MPLYVEKEYRNQGIAKLILSYIQKDMKNLGYKQLYLLIDHTEFYEKCGWEFYLMVQNDDNSLNRMYTVSTL